MLWGGCGHHLCGGNFFVAMAGSLLTSMGVPELITCNLMTYYSLALDLATDVKSAKISSKIIANRDSALPVRQQQFARNLERFMLKCDEYMGLSVHTD